MPGGFDILGIALAFGASLSLSYVLARILVRIIYPGVRSWVEARKAIENARCDFTDSDERLATIINKGE